MRIKRGVTAGSAVLALCAVAGLSACGSAGGESPQSVQDVAAAVPAETTPTPMPLNDDLSNLAPATPVPTPTPAAGLRVGGKRDAAALLTQAIEGLQNAESGRVVATTSAGSGAAGWSQSYDTDFDLRTNEWSSVLTGRRWGLGAEAETFTMDMVGADGRTFLHARSPAWRGKPWLAYRWADIGPRTAAVESLLVMLEMAKGTAVLERNGARVVQGHLPAVMAVSLMHLDSALIKKNLDYDKLRGTVGIELELADDGTPLRLRVDNGSVKSNLPADIERTIRAVTYEAGFSGLGDRVEIDVPTRIKLVPSAAVEDALSGAMRT